MANNHAYIKPEKFLPPIDSDRKCKDKPTEFFFPAPVKSNKVKKFCYGCKVRQECLAYALHHDVYGIWGGTNDKDRERYKRLKRQLLVGVK